MRLLILIAGLLTVALGFAAEAHLEDPTLFQGALTLGGGWIICALFSYHAAVHGIVGAGVLALLAAARCLPALPALFDGGSPGARYQGAVLAIALVVLVKVVRHLLAERARRQIAALRGDSEP
jgi:hypothetical protein